MKNKNKNNVNKNNLFIRKAILFYHISVFNKMLIVFALFFRIMLHASILYSSLIYFILVILFRSSMILKLKCKLEYEFLTFILMPF